MGSIETKLRPLVIFGCGTSINEIPDEYWYKFRNMYSFGMNWFCKHPTFSPTYYLVNEAGVKNTSAKGYTYIDFLSMVPSSSIKFIMERGREEDLYDYVKNIDSIPGAFKKVVRRLPGKNHDIRVFKDNHFLFDGVAVRNTCVSSAVHFAMSYNYNVIIYAGVDLYDSRYFWGGKHFWGGRPTIDEYDENQTHRTAGAVIQLVQDVADNTDIKQYVVGRKSLLADIIPAYWGETW